MVKTKIDKALMKAVREQLDAALVGIGAQYGISLTCGRGAYDVTGTGGSMKIEFAAITEGGEVLTEEARAFKSLIGYEGYKAEALGQIITVNREQYRVAGYLSRSRTMPLLLTRVRDGKDFKFPIKALGDAWKVEGHWRWKGGDPFEGRVTTFGGDK
jgi:hypothetical protein